MGENFPEHSYSAQVLPHLKNEKLKENSEKETHNIIPVIEI